MGHAPSPVTSASGITAAPVEQAPSDTGGDAFAGVCPDELPAPPGDAGNFGAWPGGPRPIPTIIDGFDADLALAFGFFVTSLAFPIVAGCGSATLTGG